MEEKHTPLPWRIEEVRTSIGRCFKIGNDQMLNSEKKPTYVCVYDDYGRGENAQKANAALIVSSVNALPALVKALEEIAAGSSIPITIAKDVLTAYRSAKP